MTPEPLGSAVSRAVCRRVRRFSLLTFMLLLSPLLLGFVPTQEKVLGQCRKATPAGPARFQIALDGVPGALEVVAPGKHRLILDDGREFTDPGLTGSPLQKNQALWRMLDFYSPLSADDLADMLRYCGIDQERRGWVRLDGEGDRLAVTLGSQGESEPGMPQLWIDNMSHRLLRTQWHDGSLAVVGGFSSSGWPLWVELGRGGQSSLRFISKPMAMEVAAPAPVIIEGEEVAQEVDLLGEWRNLGDGDEPELDLQPTPEPEDAQDQPR